MAYANTLFFVSVVCRLVKLAPDVGVCLAVKIVGEVGISHLDESAFGIFTGYSHVLFLVAEAEFVPALFPASVGKGCVAFFERGHDSVLFIALCKFDSVFVVYDRNEIDLVGLGVILHGKKLIPIGIGSVLEQLHEMEIALAVEDVGTVVAFVASDAVSVLTEDDVSAVVHHLATSLDQTG